MDLHAETHLYFFPVKGSREVSLGLSSLVNIEILYVRQSSHGQRYPFKAGS